MSVFIAIAFCLMLSTASCLIGYRLKFKQTSMFVFLISLLIAIFQWITHGSAWQQFGLIAMFTDALDSQQFPKILVEGLLSYLLFAGTLHIDIGIFKKQYKKVLSLAFLSTFLAISLNAFVFYHLLHLLGFPIQLIEVFLLSAAISPTDPVAVLALLKGLKIPKQYQVIIAGESLLNDGISLVAFTLLSSLLSKQIMTHSLFETTQVLLFQAAYDLFGALVLGFAMMWLMKTLLIFFSKIDTYKSDINTTLLSLNACYLSAKYFGLSPALSVVFFGLFSKPLFDTLSGDRLQPIQIFWDMIDEILNAVLFFLIGLEVLFIDTSPLSITLVLSTIALTLLVRFSSVSIPLTLFHAMNFKHISIIAMSGIKGALSLAMILTLKDYGLPFYDTMVAIVYLVVATTIVLQGGLFEIGLVQLKKRGLVA